MSSSKLKLIYDRERIDDASAGRLERHWRAALRAIGRGGAAVGELFDLDEEERRLVTSSWSRASVARADHATIHGLVAEQASAAPDRVAIACGEVTITYGELVARAAQIAHALRTAGIGVESRVGICLERSPAAVVSILGILQAGGAYVPLDAAYPAARLRAMASDASVRAIVTDRRTAARLPALPGVTHLCLDGDFGRSVDDADHTPLRCPMHPDNLAYVMYTSGSTGRPKGIATPHRAVVRLVRGAAYADFAPERVFAHLAPLAFDALTFEIWGALANGARLVVAPAGPLSLADIGRLIRDHRVNTMWMTAGLFHKMVEERGVDLAPLSQLLAGGDVLSVPHVESALRHLDGGAIINGYGPTETTTFACCHRVPASGGLGDSVPIGVPIQSTEVFALDDDMRPVGVGVPGELYIGGDGLARGYLGRPGMTAERFVPHPLTMTPGARLYRTGDRVRWRSDGTLEFLGRCDAQIKIRGYRIEPGEIESALRAQAGITDTVVVAHGNNAADKRIIAYVATDDLRAFDEDRLRTALREQLPDFMIPVAIVALPTLPLTENGKVDRRALPVPEAAMPAEEAFLAPATAVERAVAAIWAELLGVPRMGRRDHFFTSGGHSLLAAQAIARVHATLGVDLPLSTMFDAPVLADFALAVEQAPPAARRLPAIVPRDRRRLTPDRH